MNQIEMNGRIEKLEPGTIYRFTVQSIGKEKSGTARYASVRSQPSIVEDLVVSVTSTKEVSVSWPLSTAKDIVGYHVERAVVAVLSEDEIIRLRTDTPPLEEPSVGGIRAIGPFTRLTKDLVNDTKFTDTGIDLSKPADIASEPIQVTPLRRRQTRPQGQTVSLCRLCLPGAGGQSARRGSGTGALRLDDSVVAAMGLLEGGRDQVPILKWAEEPGERGQGLPRLSHGIAAQERPRPSDDAHHGRADRRGAFHG